MTEKEWLICGRPNLMLAHLQKQFGLRGQSRKLRLFICACCRLGWDLIATPEARAAVETAECFADGQVTREERDAARWKLMPDYLLRRFVARGLIPDYNQARLARKPQRLAIFAIEARNRLGDAAYQTVAHLVRAWTELALGSDAHQRPGSEWKQYQDEKREFLSNVVRDIFGNPFHALTIDPFYLAWNDRTVTRLAQTIYDERAFDHLPILADALEEAGCTDADLLNHCRQPGEHARGCWATDLLLGKS